MSNLKNKRNGITLIALVVTIIVLLILAVVSFRIITGDNGIMNKAESSVSETEKAKAKEQVELFISKQIADYYETGHSGTLITYLENALKTNENNGVQIGDYFVKKKDSSNAKIESSVKVASLEGIYASLENTQTLTIQVFKGTSSAGKFIVEGEIQGTGKVHWTENVPSEPGGGSNEPEEPEPEEPEPEEPPIEESIAATMSLNKNKLTEGTEITIGGSVEGGTLSKAELKAGEVAIYSQEGLSGTEYNKTLEIEDLNIENLKTLEFNNDYTLTLTLTSATEKTATQTQNNIRNYTMGTAANLSKLATIVNGGTSFENETIYQIADIDLSSVCHRVDGTSANDISWTPIGIRADANNNIEEKAFAGTYNGNDKEIQNIYINADSTYQALFRVNRGTIENINLVGGENSKITNDSKNALAGVVYSNYGTIRDCTNNVLIYALSNSGGVVGANYGIMEKCCNTANVGYYTSDVKYNIGGITSGNTGTIKECINKGMIKGYCTVGGIFGCQSNDTAKTYNCYNIGTVTASNHAVGGIGGANGAGVFNCYNLGSVTGSVGVGEIVGYTNYGSLTGTTSRCPTSNADKTAAYLNTRGYTVEGYNYDVWQADVNPNINGGYPILKWQVE